jgi:hypothetical protein
MQNVAKTFETECYLKIKYLGVFTVNKVLLMMIYSESKTSAHCAQRWEWKYIL